MSLSSHLVISLLMILKSSPCTQGQPPFDEGTARVQVDFSRDRGLFIKKVKSYKYLKYSFLFLLYIIISSLFSPGGSSI